MEKKNNFMDLNRETAMRLWGKSFGKETKVKDFTGRLIVKGAYNDRNSEFGWNVDHILPQSKGGKTADYNLVCCHILTNDEKADKFPCFSANGKPFEIVKVENHYEIQPVSSTKQSLKEEDTSDVNYYDSASGIKFFKGLKGIQNKPRFVGTVIVRLDSATNTALVDFIENFFDEENISYSLENNYSSTETKIVAKNYNMPLKEDISKLLDKCVLLNTYLGCYFAPSHYLQGFDIYFRVDYYNEKTKMYIESQKTDYRGTEHASFGWDDVHNRTNTLYINDLVYENTEAKTKIDRPTSIYAEYGFVFSKLSENLKKEVNKE